MMKKKRAMGKGIHAFFLVSLLFFLVSPSGAAQEKFEGPCGVMPKAKPKRIKGGEGIPPLPLPVTPLRRTERKRNPSPPVLIGKVKWGQERSFHTEDGERIQYFDWNNDPNDLKRLLEMAKARLKLRYRSMDLDLDTFSFNPDEIPILWITGTQAPEFSQEMRAKLRRYLLEGGTLWGDACRGSTLFVQSFREEAARIFPEKIFRPLGPDHPLFSCAFDLKGRALYSPWTRDRGDGAPYLEGLNLGCRTAVVLCPYALSCAWDSGHQIKGCAQMTEESAFLLGFNMLVYAIAYRPLGRFLSQPVEAWAKAAEPGGFVFAQARFAGEYDPDPSAFGSLLKHLSLHARVKVALSHPFVAFSDTNLKDYPFVYMTGHGPFLLTPEEKEGLRSFVQGNGFLLVDACCGDLQFDQAFRQTVHEIFPASPLIRITAGDPIFQAPERIGAVSYSPKVPATWPGLKEPYLEGIARDGRWCIIYSRFDLGCGWEGEEHPYRMGLCREDALRLAVNVIVYAMTH